ncbi:MAG: putative Ig domain-containing protein [Steroidobacteraceae bacterium]
MKIVSPLSALAAATVLLLAGCSSGSTTNTSVTGTTGVSAGVTLSLGDDDATLLPSGTRTITATVTDDSTNAGVTWTLQGEGTLSNATTTTVTYTAPDSVTGTAMAVITATSIADTSKSGSVTLEVAGTPVLTSVELFPAYVDIPYATRVVVAGGEASYSWEITSGTLPDGLSLGSSTSSQVVISGTPTTEGSSTVTLQVTDAESRTATVDLTFVVNATVTCLLDGQYAVLYSGFSSSKPTTRLASLTIDSSGNVTGAEDFKSGSSSNTNGSISGTCTVAKTNAGKLKLSASSGDYKYTYATATDLAHGRLQRTGSGTSTGTGSFYEQDSSAFALATLAGDYAFGLVGTETSGTRLGLAGRFTVDSSGNITNAYVDRNGSTPLTDVSATGTMSAPDTNGRGTISLTADTSTINLVYYVLNSDKLIAMNGDTATNADSLSGAITRQSGTFSSASLDTSAVLSLWGAHGSSQPRAAAALGRLSGASSGTLSASLDETAQGSSSLANSYSGSYSVDSYGRAALTLTGSSTSRSFAVYLDATSNGYVVEHDSTDQNTGLLEAQSGTFDNTLAGQFISNTQFPITEGPMSLLPIVVLHNGIISANYASGYFYLDNDTGRGIGSLTTTAIGTDAIAFYELGDSRVRILKFGSTIRNASIDWIDR